jgi:hypothetical protein
MNKKDDADARIKPWGFGQTFLGSNIRSSCLGKEAIGGKTHGLALVSEGLAALNFEDFPGISVDIPSMLILCTDVFDAFMDNNHLHEIAYSDLPDDRIAYAFQKASLPFEVLGDLRSLINEIHIPLAIRSSGLLEDATHEPFAGVYSTKMISNNQYDPDMRFLKLTEAIKYVYASTFSKTAKDYCKATGLDIHDEKMAVIIQELVGKRYHDRFYPEMSGVARSYNYYPLKPAKPQDGVVNLALGLGKTIVDGDRCWTYSPAYPAIDPPYGSVDAMLKDTQTGFWAVNMGEAPEYNLMKETEFLRYENLSTAEEDGSIHYLASTYNPMSGRLSPGTFIKGPRVLTFAPLLVIKELPFNELIKSLLVCCEKLLNAPVEIEFAMTFNPPRLGFLQVRPLVVPIEDFSVQEIELDAENILVASETVLGHGIEDRIEDVVYVRPDSFELKHTSSIVPELEERNNILLEMQRPYLLIVFGRLGTLDPWLGIPVNWGQICGAKAIIEATQSNVRVELSQGSHYFHNIINMGVKYFSLPFSSPYQLDWKWLEQQEVVKETGFIRHVRLSNPLMIRVDGRNGRGVIKKAK